MEKIIDFFYLNENKNKFPKNFNKKSNIYKLYILSSFCYLFIGVLILTVFKNTVPNLKNILFIQGILLIIQSIFTYFADVKSNGKKSNLHIYDRLIAIFNTIFVISNILWLPPIDIGIYIITLITGLLILKKSRNARHNFKFKKYVMYHSLWHLWFPLGLLFWLLYNYFNNINYKNFILLIVFISNSYIISVNGF
tara:strand:- start:1187 stop:1771 length:585 start_codon:yes stop_codon:yes gene_type:complete